MTNEPTTNHPAALDVDPVGGRAEVVRSEERLQVGTRVQVSGRAVLRKYIVTETITQTFEVRHEEVRVDFEPAASEAGDPSGGAAFDDRVIEVVLHREVPRVVMDVVAVERVRLHTDTVTTQVSVAADVRKEEVELDLPDQPARR